MSCPAVATRPVVGKRTFSAGRESLTACVPGPISKSHGLSFLRTHNCPGRTVIVSRPDAYFHEPRKVKWATTRSSRCPLRLPVLPRTASLYWFSITTSRMLSFLIRTA